MYCKHCMRMIDDNADFCPACGKPQKGPIRKPIYKRWWFWAIVAFLVIGIGGDSDEPEKVNYKASEYSAAQEDNDDFYYAGMYKVGSDIPAGEYLVAASNGSGYFSINADSTGSFDSIIANGNFDTFVYVTVSNGQYFEVERAYFADASQYSPKGETSDGYYKEGMYRVGTDIPAGEYKAFATGSYDMYIEIASDSFHSIDSIITNDNVSSSTYITVTNGQYLTVTRGQFKLV